MERSGKVKNIRYITLSVRNILNFCGKTKYGDKISKKTRVQFVPLISQCSLDGIPRLNCMYIMLIIDYENYI